MTCEVCGKEIGKIDLRDGSKIEMRLFCPCGGFAGPARKTKNVKENVCVLPHPLEECDT